MPENDFLARESDHSEREVAQPSTIEVSMTDAGPAEEMQAAAPEVRLEMPHEVKETDVIDVHAPHGGIGSWKDFWIHLGTIALGLLIAIGLEQTVEYFHHLHQRHQLEEDLHAEAQKNLAIMDEDFRYCDALMAYVAANRERVDEMRAGHGKVKLSYIPRPSYANEPRLAAPLGSVWATAKESQLVALLPREEARFYDRVYRQLDTYLAVNAVAIEAADELENFQAQFNATPKTPWEPVYPDLSRMSAEQLDQESALLIKRWGSYRLLRTRLDIFYAAENAVLHGGATDGDVLGGSAPPHHPLTIPPVQADAASAEPDAKKSEGP